MRWPIPTPRCAALLTGIAVTALFLPVGITVAAALVLVATALTDAWAVRRAPAIERTVAPVLSLRAPTQMTVRASSPDARRVWLRQPSSSALGAVLNGDRVRVAGGAAVCVHVRDGEAVVAGELVGQARGGHTLPGVACASIGPLGLARVHHTDGPSQDVRVYPDLAAAHLLVTRLRRELAGQAGRVARGALGLGTDFESVREYTPDDDIRQLNWRATARLGRPMSNQYRLERDRDVVCLIDVGRLMAAPAGPRTLLDVALDAVAVLALAADELGDRCGAIAFDEDVRVDAAPRHRAARRVLDALLMLQPAPVESDFQRAFGRVGGSRRALVTVFTDLVDEAAARSLLAAVPMLARRHALVIASARDADLEAAAATDGASELQRARALVARDVLDARERAARLLTRAGATVLEAPAGQLGVRCLQAYVEAKSRGRV